MANTSRPTAEELLAQARWVKRLARNLSADESQAEDLAQETWLAALRHAPERLGSLRSWLARVMRNAAHHEGRRRALRLERERRAATPEALPSTERLAERAELQRLLVGALLALEEPYRSTLLWRYFDDLSSEEIARRLRVPASTVRNRHQRALELLRGVLERSEGTDWRASCIGLAAWGAGSESTAAGFALKTVGGGLLMGAKLKLVLGALVVLVGSIVLWNEIRPRPEPDEAAHEPVHGSDSPASTSTGAAADGSLAHATEAVRSDERRLPAPGAAASGPAAGFLVFGAVHTIDGPLPSGARVVAQDEWGERAGVAVDSKGSYSLAGLHAGIWTLDLRDSPGWYAASQPVELRTEPIVRVDLEPRRAPSVAIRLLTTSGASPESLFRDDVWQGAYTPRFEVVATREPLRSPLQESQLLRSRCGTYTAASEAGQRGRPQVPEGCSGLLELDRAPPAFASVLLRGRVLGSAGIREETRELTFTLDPESVLAELGGLRFRLLDARTGEPQPAAATQLYERSAGEWANPLFMDLKDGHFERQRLPAGEYELQIRVPGFEHLVRRVQVDSRRTTDLGDILLAEGSVLRGRVVDESGKGLSLRLAWSRLDGAEGPSLIEQGSSQADGSFAIAELPQEGVRLCILDPEWALDPLTCRARPGVIPEIELVARRGTELILRQRRAESEAFEWLLSRADGTPLWSALDLQRATHRLRLVSGTYVLAVRLAGRVLETRNLEIGDETVSVDLGP